MSQFRIYFFDEAGNELLDHPMNGKTWLATAGSLSHKGKFNHLFKASVTVSDFSSLRDIKGERVVTINDFPGRKKVGVKVWYAPKRAEKFWLVAPDYLEKREADHPQRKADERD